MADEPKDLATVEKTLVRRRMRDKSPIEQVDGAFKRLQVIDEGTHSLVEWAKRNDLNLGKFYATIWGKRIPSEVSGEGGGPVLIAIREI